MVVFLRVLILSSISPLGIGKPLAVCVVCAGCRGLLCVWVVFGEWLIDILVACTCLALCGVVHKLSIFCFLSWVSALGCLICGRALFCRRVC